MFSINKIKIKYSVEIFLIFEFVFVSDPDESVIASGWYIDDVQVTIPAP